MPELPEVEVTRRGLLPHISGRVISGVEIREPRLRWPVPPAVRRLAGRTIRSIRRRRQHLRQREPVPRRDPSAHAGEAPVARALRPACRRPQGNLARRDPRRRLEPARLRRSRRQPGLFPAALLGVRTRGPALQAMRERDPPHRAGAALYFFLPALSALAAPAFSRFSTTGSTNFDTSPPNAAISRTSVAEMNMCCSEGVRKMVSRSG